MMVERAGRVEGKVAIVTGAGSTPGPGIGTGKASAVVLAREGARVLLVDLYPERAEETRKMILEEGGQAEVFAADVTQAAQAEAMVKAAVEAFGTLDILVNNIGLAQLGTVVDTTEEAWDRALDINLRTVFLASKYSVPVMAEKGAGAIVNISSISALRGDGTVAYSAAKGGIIAMTIDMAYSHGRQGIRVNAIAPGHITTPMVMSVSAPGPRRRFHEPDAVRSRPARNAGGRLGRGLGGRVPRQRRGPVDNWRRPPRRIRSAERHPVDDGPLPAGHTRALGTLPAMATAKIDGLSIAYEVSGQGRPWVITPGGRFSKDSPGVRELAEALAGAGNRVLIWDRPNCGKSDVCFTGSSESAMQADVLAGLLAHLDMAPAVIAGGSGGARVSLLTAVRHREAASALAMWWISGGVFGLLSLGTHYCRGSIRAAWDGGMEAVVALPEWAEVLERNPVTGRAFSIRIATSSSPRSSSGWSPTARVAQTWFPACPRRRPESLTSRPSSCSAAPPT